MTAAQGPREAEEAVWQAAVERALAWLAAHGVTPGAPTPLVTFATRAEAEEVGRMLRAAADALTARKEAAHRRWRYREARLVGLVSPRARVRYTMEQVDEAFHAWNAAVEAGRAFGACVRPVAVAIRHALERLPA